MLAIPIFNLKSDLLVGRAGASPPSRTTGTIFLYTSVKIIKNEVGCRDDTVPKTVDTRRHCEEE